MFLFAQADAKTNRFKEAVLSKGGTWREIYGIDEKKVANYAREDKIDILVELTGHTANNRLGVMACRPSPVQVHCFFSGLFGRRLEFPSALPLTEDRVFKTSFTPKKVSFSWAWV